VPEFGLFWVDAMSQIDVGHLVLPNITLDVDAIADSQPQHPSLSPSPPLIT
jgi:hypothetical protein